MCRVQGRMNTSPEAGTQESSYEITVHCPICGDGFTPQTIETDANPLHELLRVSYEIGRLFHHDETHLDHQGFMKIVEISNGTKTELGDKPLEPNPSIKGRFHGNTLP